MLPRWYKPPPYDLAVSCIDTVGKIASLYGLTADTLRGPSRERHICRARWHAMRTLRDQHYSTPTIARVLNRDHATVLHGLRYGGSYR